MPVLDSVTGKTLKQAGQDSIESHNRHFIETMRECAKTISRKCGQVTSDNLRVIAENIGLTPTHPNVWGSVFRGKRWKVIGRQKTALPAGHDREIRIWRWVA